MWSSAFRHTIAFIVCITVLALWSVFCFQFGVVVGLTGFN